MLAKYHTLRKASSKKSFFSFLRKRILTELKNSQFFMPVGSIGQLKKCPKVRTKVAHR